MKYLATFLFAFLLPLSASAYTITVNTTLDAGSGNALNSVGFATNDTALGAQSFTTVAAGSITSVDIKGVRDGTNSTNYYMEIRADSSGSPVTGQMGTSTGKLLSTFAAIAGDFKCVTTNPPVSTFTFPTPVPVAAATTYWVVMSTNGVYDINNGIRWCGDATSNHSQVMKHSSTNPATWVVQATSAGYLTLNVSTGSFSFWQWGWAF